ncbi:diguanylate cyclase [Pelosinus fermentans]|nr:diguanylate cyclase [Pelosinus fermentans]
MTISSSIGISFYPADGEDVDSLVKKADNAMYQAKASGKDAYRFADQA